MTDAAKIAAGLTKGEPPMTLLELAARCEAAEGPDRELDALIAVSLGAWPNTLEAEQSTTDEGEWSVTEREPDGHRVNRFSPERYTHSIDAALTLVPEGWNYAFSSNLIGPGYVAGLQRPSDYAATDATAATPALALCAAALRARAQGAPMTNTQTDQGEG